MTKPHSPAQGSPNIAIVILALVLVGLGGGKARALAPGIDQARSQLLLLVGSYQVEGTPAMSLFIRSLVCASHSKSLVPIMAELNKASVRDRWFAINKNDIASKKARGPSSANPAVAQGSNDQSSTIEGSNTLLFRQKMFFETLAKDSTEVDFKAFSSCLNPSRAVSHK